MKYKKLNQIGDTIVEVMIAVAVLGTVIGGVYSVASRSLRNARQAQERSEALKYTESQIEQLKQIAPDNAGVFAGDSIFCMDGGKVVEFGEATLPNLSEDDFAAYPNDSQDGGSCVKDQLYHVAIESNPVQGATSGAEFTVVTRWDRLGGGRDEVKMLYRMYE